MYAVIKWGERGRICYFVSSSVSVSIIHKRQSYTLILYSPHPVLRLHLDMEESLSFNPAYLLFNTAQTNPSSSNLRSYTFLFLYHVGYTGHVWLWGSRETQTAPNIIKHTLAVEQKIYRWNHMVVTFLLLMYCNILES